MRGVNKLVIEVRPDEDYFEKALLFIKPGTAELPQNEISDRAERLLTEIYNGKLYDRSNTLRNFMLVLAGAVSGSALTAGIMFAMGPF